jgi:lipopolysaccharide export system permease protein
VPLLLGGAVSLLALLVATVVAPAGLRDAARRIDDVIRKNLQGEIRSGVFYEDIPGLTVYAAQAGPQGLRDVLIADRTNPSAPVVTLARTGRIQPDDGNGMRLVLEDGEVHREEPGASDYVVARFARATADLGLGQALEDRNWVSTSAFELSPREIIGKIETEGPGKELYWRTFLWRRMAVPLGILALGLLAVPIAALRRGGRGAGYAVSLLAIVAYYALLRTGEALGHEGALPPWLAANLANLVVLAVAVVLLGVLARRGTGAVR